MKPDMKGKIMKKYVFLIAGLTAASALAHGRDPASIGNRLGDGAYMKATGLSPVEWAAQCEHQKTRRMSASHQLNGYSETQRLMPEQTPVSTETLQGQSQTIASSANTAGSVSAGSSSTANYSATMNDSLPESLTDNHHSSAETATSSGKDISQSYNAEHTPIYTDKSDLSAAGAPAKSESGSGSSVSNPASLPIGGKLSSTVSSDVEWAARVKSDLTSESPQNTTAAETFTAENLRNVDIHRANGVVTLTGSVPDEGLKRELETRIREISGFDTVNNQLKVVPTADKPATPDNTTQTR